MNIDAAINLPPIGNTPAWLAGVRQEAIERFRQTGFPTPRLEAWKFTNLSALAGTSFREASPAEVPELTRADIEPYRLTPECHLVVFVNGRFRADLSDLDRIPDGSRVVDLSQADEADLRLLTAVPTVEGDARARVLADLNTARMTGGAVVHLGRGAVLDPVQLLFVGRPEGEPMAFHLRNLIQAEAGSSATVLESYVSLGKGPYWTNAVTRVVVAPNAVLRHYKLQAEGIEAFHIAAISARLEQEASYAMFAASLGSRLARHEVDVDLAGERAEAKLSGAMLGRDAQHLDTTVRVEHSMPGGTSSQEFKSVVDDRAHTVFQGRIHVAPDAQKTDAQQVNRSLLLSPQANADAKPELIILADDVKCSHGATIGDLDEDAMFYLRARGLDVPEARAILIDAFVAELIEHIGGDEPRAYFRRAVDRWLAGGGRS